MRKSAFVLLIFVFLLIGCQRADPEPTEAATSKATEPTTEMTTEPTTAPTTAATTAPTTAPTVTTEATEPSAPSEPFHSELVIAYRNNPYYEFVFDGEQPFISFEIKLEGLVKGGLYLTYKDTQAVTVITEKAVAYNRQEKAVSDSTREHIYYVTEEKPGEVIRSDTQGIEQTVVYTSDGGAIQGLWYHGVDAAHGKLLVNEAYARIVLFDIATGEKEVMVEHDSIETFGYEWHPDFGMFELYWFDKAGLLWKMNPETGEVTSQKVL